MRIRRASTPALALVAAAMVGCASSVPAPAPRPTAAALDGVHRIVIVASGESRFTVEQGSTEAGRVLDEVVKWLPYQSIVRPLAQTVYAWLTSLIESDRASDALPRDVTPATFTAEAFERSLRASGGGFDEIVSTGREPTGDTRANADAIVRVSVPSWGFVCVRDGKAPLVAAFADVRAEIVLRGTGVVVWQHDEDVTHPEELSLEAVNGDRALAREQLTGVLERAGRRLASELVYARGAGR